MGNFLFTQCFIHAKHTNNCNYSKSGEIIVIYCINKMKDTFTNYTYLTC